jgi:hypothetical protein
MRSFLRRLFGRRTVASVGGEDFSWIFPPNTMLDPAPWDRYWHDQFTHGIAGFSDIFCDDGSLVDAMRANGLRTALCVGNGISQEPRALARAGFDVTALDLSPFATEMAKKAAPVDQTPFALQHADDRQHAVVMRIPRQSLLNLFDGRLAHLPDNFHDLQLPVGEAFRGFSRHISSLFAAKTNLYVYDRTLTYKLVDIKRNLKFGVICRLTARVISEERVAAIRILLRSPDRSAPRAALAHSRRSGPPLRAPLPHQDR